MSQWLGMRVETWWWLEKRSDRLWELACRDGVSCWLDWLPAFTFRHRKQAERRHFEHRNGVPL